MNKGTKRSLIEFLVLLAIYFGLHSFYYASITAIGMIALNLVIDLFKG
jgi:hypothetical protein